MTKVLALNLAAGANKGVIQATILKYLSKGFFDKTGKVLPIQYLAGVSIGAFNAVAVIEETRAGSNFFGEKALNYFNNCDDNSLENFVNNHLSDLTFGTSPLKLLLLSTSLNGLNPTIWTNFGSIETREGHFMIKNSDNLSLDKALVASAAMPFLINAQEVKYDGKNCYEIDGAILAKSPSTLLLANLINLEKVSPQNLVILSLSCGHKATEKDFSSLKDAGIFGYSNRMKALIASSFDSHEALDDSNSQMILEGLGGKFLTFNPMIKDEFFYKHYDFSQEHIQNLVKYSNELIIENQGELELILDNLVQIFAE